MRSLAKWVISIFVVSVAVPAVYYVAEFAPHRPEITREVTEAMREYGTLPSSVYELALLSESDEGIRSFVTRNLLQRTHTKFSSQAWHIHFFALDALIGINYTDEEIFALWCQYYWAKNADGVIVRGLRNAAEELYEANLRDLDIHQIASLVALIRAPGYYWNNPSLLSERADEILDARGEGAG